MKNTFIVIDLGYGDSGKGTIVDYLTFKYNSNLIVRYCGGAQAAHNVVTPDERHHTFSQFGSGTFHENTKTLLSRFMMVNPIAMFEEERLLRKVNVNDAFSRMFIDKRALITTPFHWISNRINEIFIGKDKSNGSCGSGIGETMSDWLTYGDEVPIIQDLENEDVLVEKLRFLQSEKIAKLRDILKDIIPKIHDNNEIGKEVEALLDSKSIDITMDLFKEFKNKVNIVNVEDIKDLFNSCNTTIFEGSQGVLLDEWYGFHPYTTWSTTTLRNAYSILDEIEYKGDISKVGVIRAYSTRHGNGPFVTEDEELTKDLPEIHTLNDWQGKFRVGCLDLVAIRYAMGVIGGVDFLAITNIDRIMKIKKYCLCDNYKTEDGKDLHDIPIKTVILDLESQEELTRMLMKCESEKICYMYSNTFLKEIQKRLNIICNIFSYGPTYKDKYENI